MDQPTPHTPNAMDHPPITTPPVEPDAFAAAPMPPTHPHPVDITVNGRPVRLPDQEATGSQIKEAAIAEGVSIQLDFVLMVEMGQSGKRTPVQDDELVHLHEHERFYAIPPDDNSSSEHGHA